jgi:hypothetical protein
MDRQENINNFFKEYKELCKKYNVSLAHEDVEGGFLIDEYDEDNIDWVLAASDNVERKQKELERINNWRERAVKAKRELFSLLGKGEYFHRQLADKIPETKDGWDKLYTIRNSHGDVIRYATKNEITLYDTFHGYELWHGEIEDYNN